MDPRRFDAFVRSLETAGTRRSALGLAGGILAALGADGLNGALARQRHRGQSPAGAAGRHGQACGPGLTRCKTKRHGHVCVDLQNDHAHCGKCRHACAARLGCNAGKCACIPDPVETTCAGKCGTIVDNCGQNVDCTSNCQGCCNGSTCVGFDQQTDQTCGSLGHDCRACPAGSFCDGGNCDCIGAGGGCDPAGPDHCCADFGAICGSGTAQPDGTCCIQNGNFCLPTSDQNCVPDSGCCCSGFCDAAARKCAEPPTS